MLPKMINKNGNIYNTVGMIKLNNGAFLMGNNGSQLASFDFAQIPGLNNIPNFEVKKSTKVEEVFMSYIESVIQDKMNNGQIDNLTQAISDVNKYINSHSELLSNMSQLDNKDNVVEAQKSNLLSYFAEEMNGIIYFQQPVVESVEIGQSIVEDDTQLLQENNSVSDQPTTIVSTYPEYNEQTVDMILQQQSEIPNPNFDVTTFVKEYFNHFTMSQMNILLSGKIAISEQLQEMLKQRKSTMQVYNSLQEVENKQIQSTLPVAGLEPPAKRKKLIFKEKRKNEAAFVDTLLLSFTVGTICGVYLMYFVLTIVS